MPSQSSAGAVGSSSRDSTTQRPPPGRLRVDFTRPLYSPRRRKVAPSAACWQKTRSARSVTFSSSSLLLTLTLVLSPWIFRPTPSVKTANWCCGTGGALASVTQPCRGRSGSRGLRPCAAAAAPAPAAAPANPGNSAKGAPLVTAALPAPAGRPMLPSATNSAAPVAAAPASTAAPAAPSALEPRLWFC
eukprot:TRINITY_DN14084_c0_g1_i1.p1 TRINITY_DN14084_c0_g1~~TRINITY_DN14084_c0_g1_i1.p1  ORF type:complete len:189 (+),score=22.34 TRINITY_DN14084_c0_g1_i1:508-1074(+)